LRVALNTSAVIPECAAWLKARKQHSASVQVTAVAGGGRRLIGIVDVLPNEIAPYIDGQLEQAALATQKALGQDAGQARLSRV
jgi:hypothetical protein